MLIEQSHFLTEHCASPERLSRHFTDGWTILLTLRTSEFTEHAHVGQLRDHTHRMGLLIAARIPMRPRPDTGE